MTHHGCLPLAQHAKRFVVLSTVPEPGSSSVDGIMCVDTCGESNGGLLGKLQSHLVGMYAGTYLLMLLCI